MLKYLTFISSILVLILLIGCTGTQVETGSTTEPVNTLSIIKPTATSPAPTITIPSPAPESTGYEFPASVDVEQHYLFYLHGKIIEDQGIPAVSPDFGEYEYGAILEQLSGYGFTVISDQRPKNTDSEAYARKVAEQVRALLDAGAPATNITIVGASKGAGIAVLVSHSIANEDINYVVMAICNPDAVEYFKQAQIYLTGNVLSIYDLSDELAGSCQELFSYSEGKGLTSHDEVVLEVGTGHGILYEPLDEWILPTVRWANGESP